MAEENQRQKSLERLKQEIAHSRMQLGRDLSGLGHELNLPRRLRQSFQRRSKLWIAGALLIGVAVTAGRGGKRVLRIGRGGDSGENKVLRAGVAMGVARVLGSFLRPIVIGMITKKLRGYASGANRNW